MTKIWGSKKWQTWVAHALIAAAVTLVLSRVVPPAEAARLAVWGYLFREFAQQIHRLRTKQKIFVFDSIMDVLVAVNAAALIWWLLT